MKTIITLIIFIAMSKKSANAQNGQYAEVNGLHMYYEEYGKGSPLVLIHGAASTVQTSYGRLIPELSKTAPDHRCGIAGAWSQRQPRWQTDQF